MIAPEPNFLVGTLLLGLAFLLAGLATSLAFEMKWFGTAVVVLMFLCAFAVFDYKVLFVPQRGKEATALLTQGYHIVDECSMRPYHDDDPTWMTDEQQKWVGAVGRFVETKMDIEYQQIWTGAKLVGLVSDKDMNGFRCTDMSTKVGALETIISRVYNSKLQHRAYNGPTYVFTAVDGKVDISRALHDALKNGSNQANVTIDGGNTNQQK